MKRYLALVAGSATLLAANSALPCGAPFGSGIQVDPKQDIIVAWKDSVETYVFQPTFCGTASDFGLILPIPSSPTRNPELIDQKVFTTAVALSEPEKRPEPSPGMFACGGTDSAGSKAGAMNNGPTVVASGRVGFLDWVELEAKTVASFTDWLTANGYPYPDTALLAFSFYVQQGWHFLAFRISQDAAPGSGTVCKALGPISLSFPSATPVVPARMGSVGATVSGSSSFTWRIFGITRGDVQLTASAGSLQYSGAIQDGEVANFAGLAQSGDRLTRMYLTFYAGASGISDTMGTAAAHDYRAIEYVPDDGSCSVGVSSPGHHNASLALVGLALLGLMLWRRRR